MRTLPPPPPRPAESVEHERVIRRQLSRTSWQVRLVDLGSAFLVWVIGIIGFFLAAALADHLVGLGMTGRFVTLAALLGGSAWYGFKCVLPLLIHSINPTYAARTIEEATPTLKNSLINFLLLREDRAAIKEVVYQAVERKAASDIAAVPIEATIDRSRLIHAGYALCGAMALLAAYKILSPKDPFQTVARVLAPWAEIARPSRVRISEVQPGNGEVFHGQSVKISALVHGIREGQAVQLFYSTADRQTVDAPVPMKAAAGGHYECTLPPPANQADSSLLDAVAGIRQNVTYRITAGDAETITYRLTAIEAPTILVERLEYNYPAYTKLPPQIVPEQGDIKAIEGTKVTIHAAANQAIQLARIEFDADAKGGSSETLPLTASGAKASGTITLQLKPDRRGPWHASYQLRFYNERGTASQQPILHKIEVLRDLAPEVQIVRPERVRAEIPEDGEIEIVVRAADPDFGLSGVRLEGVVGGKSAVSVSLLEPEADQPPQATLRYLLRPREHKLVTGDELTYLAVAADNRAHPLTGSPEPNTTRTAEYTLVITPPRSAAGEAGKGGTGPGGQKPEAGGQGKNAQGKAANQAKNPNEAAKGGSQPQQENTKGQSQKGSQPDQGKGQKGSEQQGGQQSGSQQQGGQDGKQQGKPDGNQQQGGQQQGGQQQGGQQQGGQSGESSPNQQGQGSSGQQQAGGQQGDTSGQSGESNSEGANQQGANQQGAAGRRQGKAHDGEAIEQVFKELEKENSDAAGQQGQSAQDQKASAQGKNQQGEGQKAKSEQTEGQQAGGAAGSKSEAAGQSGAQGQQSESTGQPGPSEQKADPLAKAQPGQNQSGKSADQLPEDKQGESAAQQPSGGAKGGAPQGPSKTERGQKSPLSEGQQKEPGAGQQGEEGDGSASKEKAGSAQGTKSNRDRPKDPNTQSGKQEDGEPSPPSESKQQSNSQGGQSGDQSGGGKKGSGQSAGQEGADSAGSKTAADQGAGQAGETGAGETGSKAGSEQKTPGKTGNSGDQPGEGSSSQADEQGKIPSASGKPAKGSPDKPNAQATKETAGGKRGGSGHPVEGGGTGERDLVEAGAQPEVEAADAANLDYSRRATEMVLRRLKDEEHKPDPELLDKLGWTKEDLAEFLRRWDALQKSAEETKDGQRELNEALRSLGLRDPANRKRAGGQASDTQQGLRDAGSRSVAPPKYRDLFDAFRKGAARSRQ